MSSKPLLLLCSTLTALLCACSAGDEKAEASTSGASNASAAAASQAPAQTAASEAASASAPSATQNLTGLEQAKWQTDRCKVNGSVTVRYFKTEDGAAAQVRFKGAEFVAPFSPEMSNEDLNAFSDGQYTWTIGNFAETDFYKEDGGFLVHHESSEEMPDNMTDNLLLQECAPSQ